MICIRERHYLASLKYEKIRVTSPMAQGSGRAPWAWPGSAQGWSVGAPAECYHERDDFGWIASWVPWLLPDPYFDLGHCWRESIAVVSETVTTGHIGLKTFGSVMDLWEPGLEKFTRTAQCFLVGGYPFFEILISFFAGHFIANELLLQLQLSPNITIDQLVPDNTQEFLEGVGGGQSKSLFNLFLVFNLSFKDESCAFYS